MNFALVRNPGDLGRACEDLSRFFAVRREQNPTLLPGALLGIWLEPRLVTEVPTTLELPDDANRIHSLSIRESVSLSDVWTLCWLDTAGTPGLLCRLRLMEALIKASDTGGGDLAGARFAPVFCSALPEPEARAESTRLLQRYPGFMMEPIYQERNTGRLFAPRGYGMLGE